MRSISLLILFAFTACSVAGPAPAPAPPAAVPSADVLPEIRSLIGTAACTGSSQCNTLPLGARACGGPQAYLPWSSARTDGAALRALAGRYQEQQRAAAEASGQVSDCRFIPDPGAECRAGACQLRGNAPGGS